MAAGNLPVSKIGEFSQAKNSVTKFTQSTREFKRMKVFAKFKNENWCTNLAYVDKLAKINNGKEFSPVHQDLIERTVDGKGIKTKDSNETLRKILTMLRIAVQPTNIWAWRGKNFDGEFKRFFAKL